jgi:hypothetical protein
MGNRLDPYDPVNLKLQQYRYQKKKKLLREGNIISSCLVSPGLGSQLQQHCRGSLYMSRW